MTNRYRDVRAAYEGPIPPAERAAARWGPGAWRRIARGADAAHLEARIRRAVAALGRLRSSRWPEALTSGAAQRLAELIAQYRLASFRDGAGR